MNQIYEPAEDSFLLANVVKKYLPNLIEKNSCLNVLEVGSGSGFQVKNLLGLGVKKENIFCCDVNSIAVQRCKALGVNCVLSNLFENIKEKFNIIIFNPPYLPEDANEPSDSKLATTGGKKGSELINNFLTNAKKHLENNGEIFLLTSSLTQGINFEGYNLDLVAKKKLFFEELFVWKLTA